MVFVAALPGPSASDVEEFTDVEDDVLVDWFVVGGCLVCRPLISSSERETLKTETERAVKEYGS